MSVTRINVFQAREGQGDALFGLLESSVPSLVKSAGCTSCRVLQHMEHPTRIVVIEQWDSVAAHQAAAQNTPVHLFERTMQLSARRPTGEYYHP